MFSPALEIVLTVAYREATSRRHTHLTLEHLLYALAHDPDGERILAACGADLPQLRSDLDKYLQDSVEQFAPRPAEGAGADAGVPPRAADGGAARPERRPPGSAVRRRRSRPRCSRTTRTRRSCSPRRASPRLDVLEYITHGISKVPPRGRGVRRRRRRRRTPTPGIGERGGATARDPLAAYATNLTARARAGELDPLIGRTDELAAHDGDPLPPPEEQPGLRRRCRRRQDGAGRRPRDAAARATTSPTCSKGAEVFSLDTGALLAGTRFRGDFEERFKAVIGALAKRPMPILFIDEIHSTVGAGATTGGTMDLATLIKPILTTGQLRVVGSTTHEEFKHIEKDRALARRLQKIAIDEPSHTGDDQDPPGSAIALRGAPSRALRRRRDRGGGRSWPRGTCATTSCPTAPSTSSTKRARRCGCARGARARQRRQPARPTGRQAGAERSRSPPPTSRTSSRAWRGFRPSRPPRPTAIGCRTLEESLGRVVFGQEEAVGTVARAIKRSRAGLGQPDRPAGCFLFTGPTGVGKTELAKQLALHLGNEFIRFDMSEYMEKHAVARLIGAPPGYVGFEQGGLLVDAVRQHPYAVAAARRDREGAPRHLQHPAAGDGSRDADRQQRPQGRLPSGRADHDVERRLAGAERRQHRLRGVEHVGARRSTPVRRRRSSARSRPIEKVFSPEFRNRLDAIVTFGPLSPAVMETIVEKFILQLEAQFAERRVAITLEPAAREWLADKGYDPVYGARPLARVIQTEVRDPLTDEILFGTLEHGGTVDDRLERRQARCSRFEPARRPRRRHRRSNAQARLHRCQTKTRIPGQSRRSALVGEPGARRHRRPRPSSSLKPTYVEELEQQLAEKDSMLQEYIAKYRQAASEFEEARLRLRREISKDVERGAARRPRGVARGRRQPRTRRRRRRQRGARRCAVAGGRDGAASVPREARRASASSASTPTVTRFDPSLHEAITIVPVSTPDQDGTSSASFVTATASATMCCVRPVWRSEKPEGSGLERLLRFLLRSGMPIFEYVCRECDRQFEAFVTADRAPACPACQSANLAKQLSSPGMVGASAGRTEPRHKWADADPVPAAAAPI